MKRYFILMAAILFVDATGLHAEETRGSADDPYVLSDSVAVTANRTQTPLHEIASSITVITCDEIEKSQSAFVSHLLRNVPGVDIVQSGGTGKFTSVFIRGANAHHALVLLDGIPLNDPSSPNNAANFSDIMTANVERIEILRGPQSVLYGPEAIGGVIQIFTKPGERNSSYYAASEAGSRGTYNLNGSVSGIQNRFGYSFSIERLTTDGISSAAKSFGGTENDGYNNTGLSSRLDYKLSNSIGLNFVGRFVDSESDLDKSSDILDDPNFTTSQTDREYQVRVFHLAPDSKWNQQLSVYFGDIERTTFDGYDPAHPSDSESTTTAGQRIGASVQQSVKLTEFNKLSMGVETEKISFTSDLLFRSQYGDFADTVDEKSSWSRGIYFFDQHQVIENLFVTLGGRLDEHKQFGSTGTYRLTAAYLLDKTATRFRTVIGSGYKAPSVYQLYHPSPFIGNQDLRPERSQSWEVGIDKELSGDLITASLTFYENNFKDLIVGVENVSEAQSKGVEAAIELKSTNFSSRLDYIYCDSKDKTTEKELIRRPTHSLIFTNSYQATGRLFLNLRAKFTGKRFDQDFNQFPAPRVELDAYTVVDLAASFDVRKNLKLTGRVENLFDDRYQEIYSYGSNPASVYAGIKILK